MREDSWPAGQVSGGSDKARHAGAMYTGAVDSGVVALSMITACHIQRLGGR